MLGNSLINEMLEVIAVFYLQKQPPEMFYKKGVLEISQNSQENTCVKPQACDFIKKVTLAQLFSCKFHEISKNTLFAEHLLTTPSVSNSCTKAYFNLLLLCYLERF